MDELVEEFPEAVELCPHGGGGGGGGARQQQLVHLVGEALLGVPLGQLLPLHAGGPLVPEYLNIRLVISTAENCVQTRYYDAACVYIQYSVS